MADTLTRNAIPATIVNSGSTNLPGLEIVLYESGKAQYRLWPGRVQPAEAEGAPAAGDAAVPPEMASRFFRHLVAALPFSQFPSGRGFKSASFGFDLRIRYGEEQSPDLALPLSDPRLQALARDAREIEQLIRQGPAERRGVAP